jgi:hypothetical protein
MIGGNMTGMQDDSALAGLNYELSGGNPGAAGPNGTGGQQAAGDIRRTSSGRLIPGDGADQNRSSKTLMGTETKKSKQKGLATEATTG